MSNAVDITRKASEEQIIFYASASDFKKIPGSPIAYWVSEKVSTIFEEYSPFEHIAVPKQGLATGDNNRFTRWWHELSYVDITFNLNNYKNSQNSKIKWVPYSKGGGYRKWYGYAETVVYWPNGGIEIRDFKDDKGNERSRFRAYEYYFLPAATWGLITSAKYSCRYRNSGYVFDIGGMSAFTNTGYLQNLVALLNTKMTADFLKILNPTLNYQIGDIGRLPVSDDVLNNYDIKTLATDCITKSKQDWNSFETSWDFACLPLLQPDDYSQSLKKSYASLSNSWKVMTLDMQRLEEENNRIFIDAYGLKDEVKPNVPLEEITLTCNPVYRYGAGKSNEEYEELQRADTMRELISYAVGCMMGRYSPDTPGLQFAGGTYDHEKACTAAPSFQPDEDGILPVLADAYFEDDVTTRFVEFLRATFGKEHLSENLRFVAEAIGIKDSESPQDAIRRFLAADFFKYHMRMYKRRPIYWLFSSGKEKAFQALVYLHRYTPATLARMRTGYLHELQNKMRARIEDMESGKDAATSTAQATRINRDLTKLHKQLEELRIYDEKLHHYADQRIEIDLDDGVKYNYGLFGDLLAEVKSVTGDKE